MTYPEQLDWEHAQASAVAKGRVIVLPKDNELQIDIDSIAAYDRFLKGIEHLAKHYLFTWHKRPSPSQRPHHFHITVTFDAGTRFGKVFIDPETRILFQCLLGSDLTRETLSLRRVLEGNPHPTLFFELQ